MIKIKQLAKPLLIIGLLACAIFSFIRAEPVYADITIGTEEFDFGTINPCLGASYLSGESIGISSSRDQETVNLLVNMSSGTGSGFSCSGCSPTSQKFEAGDVKVITITFIPPQNARKDALFQGNIKVEATTNLRGQRILLKNITLKATIGECITKFSVASGGTVSCDSLGIIISESEKTCNVGGKVGDSGGCGTSCYEKVVESERSKLELWRKYSLECESLPKKRNPVWVIKEKVCSTGDKTYNFTADPASPLMRWGNCDCYNPDGSLVSAGEPYKICCQRNSDGTYTSVKAVKREEDKVNPLYEAVCPGSPVPLCGAKNFTGDFCLVKAPSGGPYPPQCPGPTKFKISLYAKVVRKNGSVEPLSGVPISTCLGNVVTNELGEGGSQETETEYSGNCSLSVPANAGPNSAYSFYYSDFESTYKKLENSISFSLGKEYPARMITAYYYESVPYYYCQSGNTNCTATSAIYKPDSSELAKCAADVGSTCYADSVCGGKCAPPVGDSQYYFCQTDRATPACGQTSGTYSTEEKCEEALARWWDGRTPEPFACYIKKGDCDTECSSSCPACPSGQTCPHKVCQGQSCTTTTESSRTCGTGCTTNDQCGGGDCPDWPPVCSGLTSPVNVSISDISASPECLPKQLGGIRDTALSWSASASASCVAIIGGGSATSSGIVCRNTSDTSSNWDVCESGSGSISGTKDIDNLQQTTTYGLECIREPYTCTFTNPSDFDEKTGETGCDKWCVDCGSNCVPCSSSSCPGHCEEHYNDDAHCLSWKQCPYEATCTRPCTNLNLGTPCTEFYPCILQEDCLPKSCLEYDCKDYNYIGTRTSKKICPTGTVTDSETVRVVQKPDNLSLKAKPEGAPNSLFGSGIPPNPIKILLTKFAEFELGARALSSSSATYTFTTKMYCELRRRIDGSGSFGIISGLPTPSHSGSGSHTISGPTPPLKDSAFYPGSSEPLYKTSQYQLYCKNQSWYNNGSEASSCYDEEQTSGNLKVEPYGTDLEPKAGWLKRIRDIFLTTRVNRGLAGGE